MNNEQKREFTGVWIPKQIVEDVDLNATEKILFVEIASFPVCFMTNETLGERCGCSEKTISRSVKNLIEKGYIRLVKYDGRRRFLKAVYDYAVSEIIIQEELGTNHAGQIVLSDRTISLDGVDKLSSQDGQIVHIDNNIENNIDNNINNIGDSMNRDLALIEDGLSQKEAWDAVVAVCAIDPHKITASSRGQIGKAVKDIRSVCESVNEIYARAKLWPVLFPGATLTPTALAKHWAALTPQAVDNLSTSKQRDKALDGYRAEESQALVEQRRFEQLLAEGKIDQEGNFIKPQGELL